MHNSLSNVAGMKHCVRYIFVIKIVTNDKQLANWFYCQVKTCIKETTVIIIVVVVGFKIGWGEPSLRYVDANINLFMTIQLKCDEMMTTNGKFFLACQRIPKSSQWKYCRTHFVYTAKMFAFGALANRLMALPFSGICSFCGHHYDVSVFFILRLKSSCLSHEVLCSVVCLNGGPLLIVHFNQFCSCIQLMSSIILIVTDYIILHDDPFSGSDFSVPFATRMPVLGFVNREWKAQQCNNWKTKESIQQRKKKTKRRINWKRWIVLNRLSWHLATEHEPNWMGWHCSSIGTFSKNNTNNKAIIHDIWTIKPWIWPDSIGRAFCSTLKKSMCHRTSTEKNNFDVGLSPLSILDVTV